jgi:hypothetical protein
MNVQTNIDDVRARIMELESATVFDQRAWARVLIALTDRPNARADAQRRMATARSNSERVVQPLRAGILYTRLTDPDGFFPPEYFAQRVTKITPQFVFVEHDYCGRRYTRKLCRAELESKGRTLWAKGQCVVEFFTPEKKAQIEASLQQKQRPATALRAGVMA